MKRTYVTRWTLGLIAAAGVGLTGCGSDPVARTLAAYDKLVECQSQPDPLPESARQFYRAQISQLLTRATSLKGSGLTNDQIGRCAAVLEKITCDQVASAAYQLGQGDCNPKGTLADGSSCSDSVQCVSGRCTSASASQCGACAPTQAAGQPCSATMVCGANLACVAGACAVQGDIGAPCGLAGCRGGLRCTATKCALPSDAKAGESCGGIAGVSCATGLFCKAGQCSAVASAGQPCSDTARCSAFYFCSTTTKQCTAIAAAKPGEPCSAQSAVCTDGYCTAEGKCAARLADGQPCSGETACGLSSVCTNQVCTPQAICPAG